MDEAEADQSEPDPYADDEVQVVDNQGIGDEPEVPIRYTITSYGADYPVDGLVKRLSDESILVPKFQRGYVWSANQASRFVESLLLGLPVPGIFLSKEKESQKLLVIDGQQRLRTLQYFYDGLFEPTEKKFALKKVQKPFLGETYKSLAEEDRRRLDDSILHATIVIKISPPTTTAASTRSLSGSTPVVCGCPHKRSARASTTASW